MDEKFIVMVSLTNRDVWSPFGKLRVTKEYELDEKFIVMVSLTNCDVWTSFGKLRVTKEDALNEKTRFHGSLS